MTSWLTRWKASFVLVPVQGSADLCQAKGRYGDPLRGGKQGVDQVINNIGSWLLVKPLDPGAGIKEKVIHVRSSRSLMTCSESFIS
jgi:hypothetical protein